MWGMCENEKFFLGKVDDGDDRKLWFARFGENCCAFVVLRGVLRVFFLRTLQEQNIGRAICGINRNVCKGNWVRSKWG